MCTIKLTIQKFIMSFFSVMIRRSYFYVTRRVSYLLCEFNIFLIACDKFAHRIYFLFRSCVSRAVIKTVATLWGKSRHRNWRKFCRYLFVTNRRSFHTGSSPRFRFSARWLLRIGSWESLDFSCSAKPLKSIPRNCSKMRFAETAKLVFFWQFLLVRTSFGSSSPYIFYFF